MGKTELTTEIRFMEIEQRKVNDRVVSGYAAVFNQWSKPIYGYFREKIDPAAFKNTDYADCVALFNHDNDNVLARTASKTLKLSVDEIGLRFEFEMPNTTTGNDLLELMKRGDISQCSFAFDVDSELWEESKENGLYEDRTIMSIPHLFDVSLVTRPAYPQTSVDIKQRSEQRQLPPPTPEDKVQDWYYAEMMLGLK